MKFLSIDTETTSVKPQTARLLSFGAVEFEQTGNNISPVIKIDEVFFSTTREVPADASRVNGLTRARLQELSGGKSLEQSMNYMHEYLYSGYNLIGYNIDRYDMPVLVSNIMNIGYERPEFGQVIDVWKLAKKRYAGVLPNTKLGTVFARVLSEMGITEQQAKTVFSLHYKKATVQAHNAAWDAYMTYLIYRFLVK